MARVKISEYAAKKLFYGEHYQGFSIKSTEDLANIDLRARKYVVKVDDGTKQRNKKGLLRIGLDGREVFAAASQFLDKGFSRVLIEPEFTHEQTEERYISLTQKRDGIEVIYNETGGNDIESNKDSVVTLLIPRKDYLEHNVPSIGALSKEIVEMFFDVFRKNNYSFLEVNPLVLRGDEIICLDMAVELDSVKLYTLGSWIEPHIQQTKFASEYEEVVHDLDQESNATFSLEISEPQGSVFTVLAGGGASLVILDELVDRDLQAEVANYSEYSGAPTGEETSRYVEQILKFMLSTASKRKVLIIGGGVANFTDIYETFEGIISAFQKHAHQIREQDVKVFVRRGGPRSVEALAMVKAYFDKEKISAAVYGPEMPLSLFVEEVHEYLK